MSSAGHKSFCWFLFLLKSKKTFVGIYPSNLLIFFTIKNYVTCLSRNHLLARVTQCLYLDPYSDPSIEDMPLQTQSDLAISSGDNKGLWQADLLSPLFNKPHYSIYYNIVLYFYYYNNNFLFLSIVYLIKFKTPGRWVFIWW